jgi:hypothetical protein
MRTDCISPTLSQGSVGRRKVEARFDGGAISSDGGALLLSEVARRHGLWKAMAACFTDHRDARLIEHPLEHLLAQRVLGLALGYEDLNDHDRLRRDPLLAAAVGKQEPDGRARARERDRGKALAGSNTLNRLELTPDVSSTQARYKKVVCDFGAMDRLLIDMALSGQDEAPERIILDIDATDDLIHGKQEGRFFHGYYGNYCYLPLYIFWGDRPLLARLRTAEREPARGVVEELSRIVAAIRSQWPETRIWLRGDSGFAREPIMAWCETHGVDFILGLSRNARLEAAIEDELEVARARCEESGVAARVYKDFEYSTRETWSRERRVIGKAEHLPAKANPRFIVTSLGADAFDGSTLYEEHYCARGDMENRIKEQQLGLFADRTSAGTVRANQLRLYFSTFAYVLLAELRRVGLAGTDLAAAQATTIRERLLKIGARVRITVRRIWVSLSEAHPLRDIFSRAFNSIEEALPRLIPE